jgi:D-3-phosphoglycerate dehydrogenase / 2-oxoglutarate reductase
MPASALTENIKIQSNGDNAIHREVSRSQSISFGSTSPVDIFRHRPSWGQDGSFPLNLKRTATGAIAKQLKPFREQDIKILLLENVNQTGKDILQAQGYQVESLKSSLPEDQLIEKIRYSRIILYSEQEADFLA